MALKVRFLLSRSGDNPYQRLLAEAMGRADISVKFDGPSLRDALLMVRECTHDPPDVVHLHWLHQVVLSRSRFHALVRSTLFVFVLLALRSMGCRLVWTVHNLKNHDRLHTQLELFVNRVIARFCDALIVHDPEAVDTVREAYRAPRRTEIRVVPHGHYLGYYPNRIDRKGARATLGLAADKTVFLFFGTIRKYKNLGSLLEAFRQLTPKTAGLLIAGRVADDLDDLESRTEGIQGVTAHLGYVPDDEVQIYMNAADAVVLPASDVLASSSAVLAMSFGRAIVAADSPHLRRLIGAEGGIIYEPRNRGGLTRALKQALTADLESMGQRNLQYIQEYTWDDAAAELLKLYRDVTGDLSEAQPRQDGGLRLGR